MKIVALIGPESVGKTTICKALHKKFFSAILPNYARPYLEKRNGLYNYEDVENIAKTQISEFRKAMVQHSDKDFLFLDTFLITTKVWFTHIYGRCPKWLQAEIEKTPIDLFLLLKPDIDWQEDTIRESPHLREYFYERYKYEIEAIGKHYTEIYGQGEIRVKRAFRAIQRISK